MKKFYCNNCNKEKVYKIRQNKIVNYRGYKLSVVENIPVCTSCNEDILVPEIENENLIRLYNEYRKKADFIFPDEIVKFRESYNISQRELVSILNWGKMTINRYENGSLPDESHNLVLKTIINNPKVFLDKTKYAFKNCMIKEKTYNKIISNVSLNQKKLLIIEKLEQPENIYNGFRKFNIDKTENLIGYIAEKVNNLYITSLNKYLWYIDFVAFKNLTRSVLGIPYIKYTHGPVIAEFAYYDIVKLDNDKYYRKEIEKNEATIIKIYSKKSYDLSLFKNSELKIVDVVVENLKELSCEDISKLSHNEDGWINTENSQFISYDYASNIKHF
ncbi:MAG: type II TA system antitoxin MqsA family protein [Clostridiales bacterium]